MTAESYDYVELRTTRAGRSSTCTTLLYFLALLLSVLALLWMTVWQQGEDGPKLKRPPLELSAMDPKEFQHWQERIQALPSRYSSAVLPSPTTAAKTPSPSQVYPIGKDGKVTVVLLAWRRLDSLRLVVRHLVRFPYMGEILIWNNHPTYFLTQKDIWTYPSANGTFATTTTGTTTTTTTTESSNTTPIRIFNAGDNMHDMAKYMACSMATYSTCYFQDDDWLNVHLDSLYTNHRRFPNLIHTNTMPLIHLEHRRWQFYNHELGMHTGFAWLGCGSFVPREWTRHFLQQLGRANLPRETLLVADMYFAIWTNQYAYQLSQPLTPLDQRTGWSERSDSWDIVYRNLLDAGDRMYDFLQDKHDRKLFAAQEQSPKLRERDARAPCHDDSCLFLTNVQPYPYPDEVEPFHGHTLRHLTDLDARFRAPQHRFPTNDFFEQHAYHYAVDNDPGTCWNSHYDFGPGSYFGLHLVQPREIQQLQVVTSQPVPWQHAFHVYSSENGKEWSACAVDWETSVTSSSTTTQTTVKLVLTCPDQRFVKVQRELLADSEKAEPLQVCEVQVL